MICDGTPSDDIKASLSPFELKLCQYFKRVKIRGKRGRKVPVILTKKLLAVVELIVNLRNAVGVNPENKCLCSSNNEFNTLPEKEQCYKET